MKISGFDFFCVMRIGTTQPPGMGAPPLGTTSTPPKKRVLSSPASVVTPSSALVKRIRGRSSNLCTQSAASSLEVEQGMMVQLLELAEHIQAHGTDRIPPGLLYPVRAPTPYPSLTRSGRTHTPTLTLTPTPDSPNPPSPQPRATHPAASQHPRPLQDVLGQLEPSPSPPPLI